MQATITQTRALVRRRRTRRRVTSFLAVLGLCTLVSYSAMLVKDLANHPGGIAPMTVIDGGEDLDFDPLAQAENLTDIAPDPLAAPMDSNQPYNDDVAVHPSGAIDEPAAPEYIEDTTIRFCNGRPIRPARTMWMLVTAYSPDHRSCGDSADGITASLHRVETNGFCLVAADTRVLPMGSMISVPGYDSGKIVPVLDRGGAIKGHRLDVLFPTHAEARAWGVRRLQVTVWEYADGMGKDNWRAIRDSKAR